jgi:hypothetical protein
LALATGDANGDRFPEIAIGAPDYPYGAGAAYLVSGGIH